jgi:putative transposase
LETVFKEEFFQAKIQRCQVHVARNVFAKVPKTLKQAVADNLRVIFYAPSKQSALESLKSFKARWGKELPSAVSSFEQSVDACLTFFDFPIFLI